MAGLAGCPWYILPWDGYVRRAGGLLAAVAAARSARRACPIDGRLVCETSVLKTEL